MFRNSQYSNEIRTRNYISGSSFKYTFTKLNISFDFLAVFSKKEGKAAFDHNQLFAELTARLFLPDNNFCCIRRFRRLIFFLTLLGFWTLYSAATRFNASKFHTNKTQYEIQDHQDKLVPKQIS